MQISNNYQSNMSRQNRNLKPSFKSIYIQPEAVKNLPVKVLEDLKEIKEELKDSKYIDARFELDKNNKVVSYIKLKKGDELDDVFTTDCRKIPNPPKRLGTYEANGMPDKRWIETINCSGPENVLYTPYHSSGFYMYYLNPDKLSGEIESMNDSVDQVWRDYISENIVKPETRCLAPYFHTMKTLKFGVELEKLIPKAKAAEVERQAEQKAAEENVLK